MRLAWLLVCLASPVVAWEFAPTPICTLTDENEQGDVRVTFDPATSLYEIRLSFAQAGTDLVWETGTSFSIAFQGPRGLTITTDRHVITDDRKALSVQDTGFGNVLSGLEFNTTARAQAGASIMSMSLDGAAEPVQAFRNCGAAVVS